MRSRSSLTDCLWVQDACYRPSIIYGNPALGIASLGNRVNQNKASGRVVEAQERVEAPAINTLAGDAPHPDDPVYRHALVQVPILSTVDRPCFVHF